MANVRKRKQKSQPARPNRLIILLPVALAILASLIPLMIGGFSKGHDWILELVRVAEFRFAAADGQRPPFWAPDLYAGMGSPIFLFYAPLYLAVASLGTCITGNVTAASGLTLVVFTIVGAALMWRLGRLLSPADSVPAAISTVVFLLQPYLLVDKWVRNADAEFVALTVLPAVLAGATIRRPSAAFWWTALGLAAVILAHNLTALVAVPLSLGLSLLVQRDLRLTSAVVAGALVALGLTTFFWLPALVLQPLIRPEELLVGKFDFHTQFATLRSFFWPSEFYSPGVLIVALLGIVSFVRLGDVHLDRVLRACAIAAAVFLFLMLAISTPVWDRLPLIRYEQFPWRFGGPLAVVLSAGCGLASSRLRAARLYSWLPALALAIALINAWPAFAQYRSIDPVLRAKADALLTREGIQDNNLRATVGDEYLPRAAQAGGFNSFRSNPFVPRHWSFPVWTATVDGREANVGTGPNGELDVAVSPEQESHVALTLREPPIRTRGKWVSALTLFALTAFAGLTSFRHFRLARRP